MADNMEVDTEPTENVEADVSPSGKSIDDKQATTISGSHAVRSVEGWIILVMNIHEETAEEDIQDTFGEFGNIKNVHLNLDRRSGYVKGYVLIEYATLDEARLAIDKMNGQQFLEKTVEVDFALVRPPVKGDGDRRGARGRGSRGVGRARSRSPGAEANGKGRDDGD